MRINRDNYEIFFMDFIDGNLSSSEEKVLRIFLSQNPDLAMELEGLGKIELQPEDKVFAQKELLKKEVSFAGINNRVDYLCVASLENDITEKETLELRGLLITNEENRNTLNKYAKAKLIPNKKLIYKDKLKLKRFSVLSLSYKSLLYASSVAAVALVAVGMFTIVRNAPLVQPLDTVITQVVDEISYIEIETPRPEYKIIEEKTIKGPPKIGHQPLPQQISDEPTMLVAETTTRSSQDIAFTMLASIETRRLSKPGVEFNNHTISFANIDTQKPISAEMPMDDFPSQAREIGFFEFAQMGFNRLSNLTGRDIRLDSQKDEEGNMLKINFETELFALSVPVKKR